MQLGFFYSSIYFNSYCLSIGNTMPIALGNRSCIEVLGNHALTVICYTAFAEVFLIFVAQLHLVQQAFP